MVSSHYRRPARLTWSGCSRTPTCAPSTPSASPSCPRTSSWPGGSVASVHKKDQSGLLSGEFLDLTTLGTPCGQSVTAPLQRLCSLKFSNPCALTFLSVCHLYTNTWPNARHSESAITANPSICNQTPIYRIFSFQEVKRQQNRQNPWIWEFAIEPVLIVVSCLKLKDCFEFWTPCIMACCRILQL